MPFVAATVPFPARPACNAFSRACAFSGLTDFSSSILCSLMAWCTVFQLRLGLVHLQALHQRLPIVSINVLVRVELCADLFPEDDQLFIRLGTQNAIHVGGYRANYTCFGALWG